MHPNVKAFLKTIRKCEGTDYPNGYMYLFGSNPKHEVLFDSFSDHPRYFKKYTNQKGVTINTSAAGAYQIIMGTWDILAKRLKLKDFSPESQDLAAIELIREKGALPLIEAGQFDLAINKVRRIWASLPGSGNNQPEKSLAQAKTWYTQEGGIIA